MSDTAPVPDGCSCKVGRLADRHGLDRLHGELERRWLGRGIERQSVRDLADYFNRQLLEAKLRAADSDVMSGEAEYLYGALTDEEASAARREEARQRLSREGIDPDDLTDDFVSYQAIHNHLTDCLEVSSPVGGAGERSVAEDRDELRRLRSRVEAVAGSMVDRLDRRTDAGVGDVDISVRIEARCADCGVRKSLTRLLADRGCDCAPDADTDADRGATTAGSADER